jgi:hypothetical protein
MATREILRVQGRLMAIEEVGGEIKGRKGVGYWTPRGATTFAW